MTNNMPENELLSAYLDGELSAAERAQVEQLLATNPAARQLLGELRALSATLKSLPRHKLDENLSESVLRIATEKMGTGTSLRSEPVPIFSAETPVVPLSKTIAGRLKNPRVWAWPVVMAVVALLLVIYNPQQQEQPLPGGPAGREIAVANKVDKALAANEPSPATPLVDAEKFKDEKAVALITEKPSDTVRYVADKAAEGFSRPSPLNSGQSLLSKASGEKNGDATLRAKIALKDMPKAAYKLEARGMSINGQTAVESLGLAARPPLEARAGAGGVQTAKGIAANRPLSAAETDEQSRIKEQLQIAGANANQVLIVHCDVTREAMDNQAFDKLLATNSIAWSGAPAGNRDEDKVRQRETAPALSGARVMRTDAQRKSPARRAGNAGNVSMVEIVYVEAPAAQIQATIAGLTSQSYRFPNVSISQTKDISSGLEELNLGEDRTQEAVKGLLEQNTQAVQLRENEELSTSTTPLTALPSVENSPQGRAQRLGFYAGDYFGFAQSPAKDSKRHLADTTEQAVPKETARSSMSREQSDKVDLGFGGGGLIVNADNAAAEQQPPPPAPQQEQQVQSGQSEQAHPLFNMQRAFFVLRIMDESSGKADAARGAEAVGEKQ